VADRDESADDALRRLEARLTQASDVAERLIAEAAQSVAGRATDSGTPPSGWQAPDPGAAGGSGGAGGGSGGSEREGDLELLMRLADRMKDLVPPELQRRLGEALRELLLAVRALIDWYLDRLERRRVEPVEVRDIPIM
jgi:hypothetical protein